MLNKEKYAKEIVDVALKNETFALMGGKICACSDVIGCTSCVFMTATIALYRSRNGRTMRRLIDAGHKKYNYRAIKHY